MSFPPSVPIVFRGMALTCDENTSNAFMNFYTSNQRLSQELKREQRQMKRLIRKSHKTEGAE